MAPSPTTQISIVFDRDKMREFRAECIRRGTSPTKEFRRLMDQCLDEWLHATQGAPDGRNRRQS
jgi:ParG